MDIGKLAAAVGANLPSIGTTTKSAGNTSTGSDRGDQLKERFEEAWSNDHVYTLAYGGKSPAGEARNVNRHPLQEWYIAVCDGNETHEAHSLTFGASGGRDSEYAKYGAPVRDNKGRVLRRGHEMRMVGGRTLSSLRSTVHAQESVSGLYERAMAVVDAAIDAANAERTA